MRIHSTNKAPGMQATASVDRFTFGEFVSAMGILALTPYHGSR